MANYVLFDLCGMVHERIRCDALTAMRARWGAVSPPGTQMLLREEEKLVFGSDGTVIEIIGEQKRGA